MKSIDSKCLNFYPVDVRAHCFANVYLGDWPFVGIRN